jgi:uncharacterized protein (DUF433 family)
VGDLVDGRDAGDQLAVPREGTVDRSPRHNGSVSELQVLDRPLYGVAQAASLLGLRAARVRAWLDGYERGGRVYAPVIREEPTGRDVVTWGEFVELGYLREYRADVALQRIRPVIAALRETYGTPFPLAHARPWVYDHELVLAVQEEAELDPRLAIVVRTGQEIILSDVAERFVRRVDFEGDAVARWRPAGKLSPVVVDPEHAFGMPTVGGIATERIFELVLAGEPIDTVAAGYEIPVDDVRAACAFEETAHSYAA